MTLAKVIILEGPDGGGKSTLANWLHDQHGYQIRKFGPPGDNENMFKTYTNALLAAINDQQPTVFDRHYLGETIYGPLLRDKDRLKPQGRDLIERLIAATGVAIVIVIPPWDALVEGWRGKDDLLKRQDQLHKVHEAYQLEAVRLAAKQCNFIHYDWTVGVKLSTVTAPSLPESVTGCTQADLLFVGERAGKKYTAWDMAFHCMTESSRYMWEALQNIKEWQESRGAWVNAFDANEKPRDMRKVVNALPTLRKVIALGGVAHAACIDQHIAATLMPHPAFWRRWHANDQAGYANLLRKVILDA